MSKIKIDPDVLPEIMVNENTIILINRLINAIEKLYGFDPKFSMISILKIFSEAYAKDKTFESQFCYEHLLYALNKLYPEEFQKELLKGKS